ncbi:HAD family hydrolase [Alicyclobacillus sendaiensis]|uniref:HAD family hydrolase n=1 Tax=Alicyclobacillus sendaiensis PA2 TaxID=3029425 RepID=A0ABT6Y1G7_ALISE|nr:HAD family hydrolase [Alicyclobacillus sendaiensis]MDI9261097.1 HAD family hydrolase [Alicyclobacillus sendaiensis PA2]
MKERQTILFDLDDTLYPFHKHWDIATRHAFETSRWTSHLDQEQLMKVYLSEDTKLWELHKQGQITLKQLRRIRYVKTLSHFGITISHTESDELFNVFMGYLFESLRPQAEVHNLLMCLQEKYNIGIVTNGFIDEQMEKIRRLELDKLIHSEHIVISEAVGYSKPDRRIFHHACSKLKSYPNKTIFVGDSLFNDVLGSLNSGLTPIWYKTFDAPDYDGVLSISSLDELFSILGY